MAESIRCQHCRRRRLAYYRHPKYGFHGLLLLLTCGLWLPVWVYAMSRREYVCATCGHVNS